MKRVIIPIFVLLLVTLWLNGCGVETGGSEVPFPDRLPNSEVTRWEQAILDAVASHSAASEPRTSDVELTVVAPGDAGESWLLVPPFCSRDEIDAVGLHEEHADLVYQISELSISDWYLYLTRDRAVRKYKILPSRISTQEGIQKMHAGSAFVVVLDPRGHLYVQEP